jgi:hypothetical protein
LAVSANRDLGAAEPDLWHAWGGATICQLELSERRGTSIRPRTISGLSQPECSGTDAVVFAPSFGDELHSIRERQLTTPLPRAAGWFALCMANVHRSMG